MWQISSVLSWYFFFWWKRPFLVFVIPFPFILSHHNLLSLSLSPPPLFYLVGFFLVLILLTIRVYFIFIFHLIILFCFVFNYSLEDLACLQVYGRWALGANVVCWLGPYHSKAMDTDSSSLEGNPSFSSIFLSQIKLFLGFNSWSMEFWRSCSSWNSDVWYVFFFFELVAMKAESLWGFEISLLVRLLEHCISL